MKKRLASVLLASMMLLTTGCAKIQEVVDSFSKEEEPIEIEFEEEPEPIIVNMIRYEIQNTYPFVEDRSWVEWRRPDDVTELGLIDKDGLVYYRTSEYHWNSDSRYFANEGGVSWIYSSKTKPYNISFIDSEGNEIGSITNTADETYDIIFRHNDRFFVQKHIVSEDRDEYYIADKTGTQVSDFTIDSRDFEDLIFEETEAGLIQVIDGEYGNGRGYVDLDECKYEFYRMDFQTIGYEFVRTDRGLFIEFNKEKLAKGVSIGFAPASVLEKMENYDDENAFYENECANAEGAFITPQGTFAAALTHSGIVYAISEDRLSVGVYDLDGNVINDSVEVGIKIIDYEVSVDNENLATGSFLRDDGNYYVSVVTADGNNLYEAANVGSWLNTTFLTISHDCVCSNNRIVTADGTVLDIYKDDLSAVGDDVFLKDKSFNDIQPKWYIVSGGYYNLLCMKGDDRKPGYGKLDGSGSLLFITVEAGEDDDLEAGVQTGSDFEAGETTITYYDEDGNEIGTETVTDDGQ